MYLCMAIKIFIMSVNIQISNNQNKIKMIQTSLGIQMELVDISAPGTEKKRDFMREKAGKKEDQRNVLPPQVFTGDNYCGVIKVGLKL